MGNLSFNKEVLEIVNVTSQTLNNSYKTYKKGF